MALIDPAKYETVGLTGDGADDGTLTDIRAGMIDGNTTTGISKCGKGGTQHGEAHRVEFAGLSGLAVGDTITFWIIGFHNASDIEIQAYSDFNSISTTAEIQINSASTGANVFTITQAFIDELGDISGAFAVRIQEQNGASGDFNIAECQGNISAGGPTTNTVISTADAILKAIGVTAEATADAILQASLTSDTTADAILQASLTSDVTADAILKAIGVPATATADAILKAIGVTAETTADAILQASLSDDTTADAILQASLTEDVTADAILKAIGATATTTADAVLDAGVTTKTVTTTVDAILKAIGSTSALSDTGLLCRYYFDEAASGTSPTAVVDRSINGYDLDSLNYTSANYNEISGNRGWESTATDAEGRALHAITSGDIIDLGLQGAQQCTIELVLRIDSSVANTSRIFGINDHFGAHGSLMFRTEVAGSNWRLAINNLGALTEINIDLTTRCIVHIVIDTTEAVENDRIRIYKNNVEDTSGTVSIAQNETFDVNPGNTDLIAFNRQAGGDTYNASPDGMLFYAAMYSAAMSAAERTIAFNILNVDDDEPVPQTNDTRKQAIVDAVLKASLSSTTSADAILKAIGATATSTADAILKASGVTAIATADARIAHVGNIVVGDFFDNFTVGSTVDLDVHDSNWEDIQTQVGNGFEVVDSSDKVELDANVTNSDEKVRWLGFKGDEIQADVTLGDQEGVVNVGFILRDDDAAIDVENMYEIVYAAFDTEFTINRVIAGSPTSLGTLGHTFPKGNTQNWRMWVETLADRVRISVEADGTLVGTVDDTSASRLVVKGFCGIQAFNFNANTSGIRTGIDNLLIYRTNVVYTDFFDYIATDVDLDTMDDWERWDGAAGTDYLKMDASDDNLQVVTGAGSQTIAYRWDDPSGAPSTVIDIIIFTGNADGTETSTNVIIRNDGGTSSNAIHYMLELDHQGSGSSRARLVYQALPSSPVELLDLTTASPSFIPVANFFYLVTFWAQTISPSIVQLHLIIYDIITNTTYEWTYNDTSGSRITADGQVGMVMRQDAATASFGYSFIQIFNGIEFTAIADAILKASGITVATTSDAILQASLTEDVTADAILKASGITVATTSDAILQASLTEDVTADAILKASGVTAIATADAVLSSLTTNTVTTTADAILKASGVTAIATADARIAHVGQIVVGDFFDDFTVGSTVPLATHDANWEDVMTPIGNGFEVVASSDKVEFDANVTTSISTVRWLGAKGDEIELDVTHGNQANDCDVRVIIRDDGGDIDEETEYRVGWDDSPGEMEVERFNNGGRVAVGATIAHTFAKGTTQHWRVWCQTMADRVRIYIEVDGILLATRDDTDSGRISEVGFCGIMAFNSLLNTSGVRSGFDNVVIRSTPLVYDDDFDYVTSDSDLDAEDDWTRWRGAAGTDFLQMDASDNRVRIVTGSTLTSIAYYWTDPSGAGSVGIECDLTAGIAGGPHGDYPLVALHLRHNGDPVSTAIYYQLEFRPTASGSTRAHILHVDRNGPTETELLDLTPTFVPSTSTVYHVRFWAETIDATTVRIHLVIDDQYFTVDHTTAIRITVDGKVGIMGTHDLVTSTIHFDNIQIFDSIEFTTIADAILKTIGVIVTTAADAILKASGVTVATTADAILVASLSVATTADAVLSSLTTNTVTTTADAILKASGVTAIATADARIAHVGQIVVGDFFDDFTVGSTVDLDVHDDQWEDTVTQVGNGFEVVASSDKVEIDANVASSLAKVRWLGAKGDEIEADITRGDQTGILDVAFILRDDDAAIDVENHYLIGQDGNVARMNRFVSGSGTSVGTIAHTFTKGSTEHWRVVLRTMADRVRAYIYIDGTLLGTIDDTSAARHPIVGFCGLSVFNGSVNTSGVRTGFDNLVIRSTPLVYDDEFDYVTSDSDLDAEDDWIGWFRVGGTNFFQMDASDKRLNVIMPAGGGDTGYYWEAPSGQQPVGIELDLNTAQNVGLGVSTVEIRHDGGISTVAKQYRVSLIPSLAGSLRARILHIDHGTGPTVTELLDLTGQFIPSFDTTYHVKFWAETIDASTVRLYLIIDDIYWTFDHTAAIRIVNDGRVGMFTYHNNAATTIWFDNIQIFDRIEFTTTADAILKASLISTTTADGILKAIGILATTTSDSILKVIGATSTTTADAILQVSGATVVSTADAILKASLTKTTTADAILKITGAIAVTTADAVLSTGTTTKTVTVDAILKAIGSTAAIPDTGLVVRYYIDEAGSGTGPTAVLDSSISGYDLDTLDYTNANYTEINGNRGWESTATNAAGRALHAITTDDLIHRRFNLAQKCTIEVVIRIDASVSATSRIFGINNRVGGNGILIFRTTSTQDEWGFSINNLPRREGVTMDLSTKCVVHVVIDTTQAVESDRIKIYKNNVEDTSGTTNCPLNLIFSIPAGDCELIIFNRQSGTYNAAPDGVLFYSAMYDVAWSATDRTTAFNILSIDDDTPVPNANDTLKKAIADAVLKASLSSTTSADAILKAIGATAISTADAILKASGVTTIATADAVLTGGGTFTATFTADAILKVIGAIATSTADAILKASGVTTTTTADAILKVIGETAATTVDAILQAINITVSTTADAVLEKTIAAGGVVVDAVLKASGVTQTATADAILKAIGVTVSTTADAVLAGANTQIVTADAILKAIGVTVTSTADAILKPIPKIATADAILQAIGILVTTTVDAILKASVGQTTTADAILKASGITVTTTVDAILKASGITAETTADAILQAIGITVASTADAILVASLTISSTADAILQAIGITVNATADAILKASGVTVSTTVDAILGGTNAASFAADAILKAIGLTTTSTTDAILQASLIASTTADARLVLQLIATSTADAILKISGVTVAATADAILKASLSSSTTADAILEKTIAAGGVVVDAILKVSGAIVTTTVDAILKASGLTATTTVDAVLTGANTAIVSADAILKASGVTVTATTDAILQLIGGTLSTTVDAILKGSITVTTTADAILKASGVTVATTVDAVLEKTIAAGGVVVDAVLKASGVTQTATADAILKAAGLTVATTVDAVLTGANTQIVTADAVLKASGITVSSTADAILQLVAATLSTTVDAVLSASITANVVADAVLKAFGATAISTADAILKASNLTVSTTADAVLSFKHTTTTSADALLQAIGITTSATADAILKSIGIPAVATADAILKTSGIVLSTTADAILQLTRIETATADAILIGIGLSVTTTVDAILKVSGVTLNTTVDAVLQTVGITLTVTADAQLSQRYTLSTTADAVLIIQGISQIVVDAVLQGGALFDWNVRSLKPIYDLYVARNESIFSLTTTMRRALFTLTAQLWRGNTMADSLPPLSDGQLIITVTDSASNQVLTAVVTANVYNPRGLRVSSENQVMPHQSSGDYLLDVDNSWSDDGNGIAVQGEYRAIIKVTNLGRQVIKAVRFPIIYGDNT